MYTYKFLGLSKDDSPSTYYYGSLPAKPKIGHILKFATGNRYAITEIEREGLVGDDGPAMQEALALADIVRREAVPTLQLLKLGPETKQRLRRKKLRRKKLRIRPKERAKPKATEKVFTGGPVDASDFEERSRGNRKKRFSKK